MGAKAIFHGWAHGCIVCKRVGWRTQAAPQVSVLFASIAQSSQSSFLLCILVTFRSFRVLHVGFGEGRIVLLFVVVAVAAVAAGGLVRIFFLIRRGDLKYTGLFRI